MGLIALICPAASASNTANLTNNVSEGYERITQGSVVYLDETYDISGVTGWADSIAWYGKYATDPEDDITPYAIKLPGLWRTAEKSQYYYTIDNVTFGDKTGWWFQFYGTKRVDGEEHGNLRAFYVYGKRPIRTNQTNTTGVISYNTTGNETLVKDIAPFILPEKPVSDYLVARGCNLTIPANTTMRIWIFGRVNGLYGMEDVDGNVTVADKLVRTLEPGSYKLLMQNPTVAKDFFTIRYVESENKIQWFDPKTFTVGNIRLDGLSPYVCMEKLKGIFPHTKDEYSIYNLAVQDPVITINRRDTVYVNGSLVLDIRGYTNANKGTKISLVVDPEDQTARTLQKNTCIGEAIGDNLGAMRYYQIYVPIYPERMRLGMHTIKATTEIGGEAYADFPISELPADSYIPNATVHYVGDRNPWVPTPTPIIKEVVKVVPGPTITVIKEVAPSQEQTEKAQQKAVGDTVLYWLILAGVFISVYLIVKWLVKMYFEAINR